MSIYLVTERKQLIRTQSSVVYERETGAGSLQFIIPQEIDGVNLTACACTLHTINMDSAGNVHALDYINNPDYPNYLFCAYTLRTEDTYKDGEIDIWLEFANEEQEILLKTSETKYTVIDHQIVADYLPDGQLDLLEEYLLKFSGVQTAVEANAAQAKADADSASQFAADAAVSADNAADDATKVTDAVAEAVANANLALSAAQVANEAAKEAAKYAELAQQASGLIAGAEERVAKVLAEAQQSATEAKISAEFSTSTAETIKNSAESVMEVQKSIEQYTSQAEQAMANAEVYAKGTAADRKTTAQLVDAAASNARNAAGYAEEAKQILEKIKQLVG